MLELIKYLADNKKLWLDIGRHLMTVTLIFLALWLLFAQPKMTEMDKSNSDFCTQYTDNKINEKTNDIIKRLDKLEMRIEERDKIFTNKLDDIYKILLYRQGIK